MIFPNEYKNRIIMKTEIEQARESIKEYRKGYGQSQLSTNCIIQLMILHSKKQLPSNDSEYCTCRVRVEGLHYDFEGKPYCADCTKRLSKT